MLEIELCRICLEDSIRMYPIEKTRYHEVFEWRTEDTMDMNKELPYSVCYLCNALLNRLYYFLKNMIDTEVYLKEILRNSSKLTYESIEKLKTEMISKPHNLSKIWLRNSNFIALDAFKGHRPPRELRRYFDHPPIMIEYHKPYEHMKLEDIPEEQNPEEVNEEKPGETKEAENEEKMESETDQIKEAQTDEINEAESEKIKEAGSEKINQPDTEEFKEKGTEKLNEAGTEEPKQAEIKESERKDKMEMETDKIKEVKSGEIKDKETSQRFQNQTGLIELDSVTTADHDEFSNDDDENISIENMRLVWSSDSEIESANISNMEIDEVIEYDNSSEQANHNSESILSSKISKTPDPIDSFLLRARKSRTPEEIAKSPSKEVNKEGHNPYLQFIEERIATEYEPQEKSVEISKPVKYHNPYLQFIEERIHTEERQQEKCVETPEPVKFQNQNLQFNIERIPVKETESKQTSKPMEIDNTITPPIQKKSTEFTTEQLEERYCNLYFEKEIQVKTSKGPDRPVSKIIKSTEPAKIVVTSEPKKYINSYVDFVKEIEYSSNEELTKCQLKIDSPMPPKNAIKRKQKKKPSSKIDPKTHVEEKPSQKNYIDGKFSGYYYFDHQKRYRAASILRSQCNPNRMKPEIKELVNKIKNRAAVLRKYQKTNLNAEPVLEENAVSIPAPDDEDQPPGISKSQEKKSQKNLPLKSKEYSDKLLTEILLKSLRQDNKNRKNCHVVESDRVSDGHKDENQGDQNDDPVALKDQADQKLKDQNDGFLEDQEDTNDRMWSDQEDNTKDSQVDRALKVLDDSIKDEDRDLILQKEDDQEHNIPNDNILTNKDPTLQLKHDYIIIEDNLEEQDGPSLVVQDVFTLKNQGMEDEILVPKEQYDQIIMLANQDDQVMEDGNVCVKIESVDEDFQETFEENHVIENVLSDTETSNNEDIMDLNNESDDLYPHGNIKIEVERNMQIDGENESYLQERVAVNENTQRDRDGPSNNENPDFESVYNEIQGLNIQEHYAIRNISQVSLMPTVQLERLPIRLIKKSTENNSTGDENDKYNCTKCDFQTTVRLLMFRHQNVHDMNKPFVCKVCQHRFISHYHLSRHKVVHDRTKYYCAYCDFKTTAKFVMDKHQNFHNRFNRYPCHWCDRRFRSPSHRSRHVCKNKYVYKCDICIKEFKNEANYMSHLNTHTVVPKSYKCNKCNKSFNNKKKFYNHYKDHRREDSQKKKYTCNLCNKTFNRKSNCNKHITLHEMPSEKTSNETEDKQEMHETEDEMELHVNESETGEEKFVCGLCPQSFDTEVELGRHAIDHIL